MRFALLAALLIAAVAAADDLPEGAEALTLGGKPLYSPAPGDTALRLLDLARGDYEADPDDPDRLIWFGRRAAYAGEYRRAIGIFSTGIERFPADPRMLRHRGHRYISVREFDRAIADLERAAALIAGSDNEVEPDGAPNPLNIPVSSLHGNVWYHLGLAYYLVQDWDNAYRAFRAGFDAGQNDDNRVSTTHWMYMILRRKGDVTGAERVLEPISADMHVIENMSYHALCLFYRGDITEDELLSTTDGSPAGAAILYGAANWHFYNGDTERAERMLRDIIDGPSWSAFGYIAAEADLAARGAFIAEAVQ